MMSTPTQMEKTAQHEPRRFDVALAWERFGILAVLVILVILMSVIAPNFLSLTNGLNVARAVSINAILAAGMTVVILTGGIDLSVGSAIALTGVSAVLLWTAGAPAIVAVLGGIIVGALTGLVNGTLIAYLGLPAFIITLGALTYIRGISYSLTNGRPLIASDLGFRGLGNGGIAGIPTPVVIMLLVYIVLWFVLERTAFGRHVYAIGGNAEAARLAGINVKWTLVRVYLIMGACAGLAGVIFAARVESGQPKAGEGYELDAIAAVVLGGTSLMGGRGRIVGTLIGALIIGVLSNGLVLMNVPFFYQLIVKGAVIVLAVGIDGLKNLKRL
ncbi:ABC transporter permease subunit [Paramicrobacterium fandaimingii]|uniref:ABC transporter permease subunit n=1 Tax=Paramicrobacterium fandaimingii TaxID=2708079 RepID=UPI001AB0360B|nr:ribose ABC transporter permease [Microbacterium fandaimingii]